MLPFDIFRVRVKVIGPPIGQSGEPVDGDGDGFYTAFPGAGDKTPMPPGSEIVERAIEAGYSGDYRDVMDYHYGDMKWSVDGEDIPLTREWRAYDDWASWEGNFRQRHVSAALMGLPSPPAAGGDVGMPEVNQIIKTGISKGQPDWAIARAKKAIQIATWMMEFVDSSEPFDMKLFRGLANVPEDSSLFSLKAGDQFTIPLSAFTPNLSTALGFVEPFKGEGGRSAMLVLEKGAKGVRSPDNYDDYIEVSPGKWQVVPGEVVTLGDFQVVKVETVRGIPQITIRHIATYDGRSKVARGVKSAKPQKSKIPRWAWTHLGGSLAKKKPPKPKKTS